MYQDQIINHTSKNSIIIHRYLRSHEIIEINIHHNIVIKRKFMYIEDVKEAININTLEERIKLKRWLISQLRSNSKDKLVEAMEVMADKDRHLLQKRIKITKRFDYPLNFLGFFLLSVRL